MKVIITKDYDEMSKVAMQHLLGHMFRSESRVNLSITAGSTPVRLYEMMVEEVRDKEYFSHVHYFNFDEIPHKIRKEEGITMSDLRKLYFKPANIPETNIHPLSEANYESQDQRIKELGGLDAVLLGIGADGHYCGNLPGTTKFHEHTTKVLCSEPMKQKIGRLFAESEDVPDYYITMGPSSIMEVKNLILIASGTKKAEIMKCFFETEVTEKIPASILKMHPNLTVIMDEEAASLL